MSFSTENYRFIHVWSPSRSGSHINTPEWRGSPVQGASCVLSRTVTCLALLFKNKTLADVPVACRRQPGSGCSYGCRPLSPKCNHCSRNRMEMVLSWRWFVWTAPQIATSQGDWSPKFSVVFLCGLGLRAACPCMQGEARAEVTPAAGGMAGAVFMMWPRVLHQCRSQARMNKEGGECQTVRVQQDKTLAASFTSIFSAPYTHLH